MPVIKKIVTKKLIKKVEPTKKAPVKKVQEKPAKVAPKKRAVQEEEVAPKKRRRPQSEASEPKQKAVYLKDLDKAGTKLLNQLVAAEEARDTANNDIQVALAALEEHLRVNYGCSTVEDPNTGELKTIMARKAKDEDGSDVYFWRPKPVGRQPE